MYTYIKYMYILPSIYKKIAIVVPAPAFPYRESKIYLQYESLFYDLFIAALISLQQLKQFSPEGPNKRKFSSKVYRDEDTGGRRGILR